MWAFDFRHHTFLRLGGSPSSSSVTLTTPPLHPHLPHHRQVGNLTSPTSAVAFFVVFLAEDAAVEDPVLKDCFGRSRGEGAEVLGVRWNPNSTQLQTSSIQLSYFQVCDSYFG